MSEVLGPIELLVDLARRFTRDEWIAAAVRAADPRVEHACDAMAQIDRLP